MENKTLEKTMDLAGNAMKLAANLSEKKDPKPTPTHKTDDNSNKATTGTQSVNVMVDSGKKREPKPVEKHIHTFPENRALTSEECELDLKKAQMEYELKKSEQIFNQKWDERNWQHRLEQEKKNEKRGKIRRIIGGILVAVGVSAVGYSIYSDYRDHRNQQETPKALPENNNVVGEGTVK